MMASSMTTAASILHTAFLHGRILSSMTYGLRQLLTLGVDKVIG
jgi:hypothetical protein